MAAPGELAPLFPAVAAAAAQDAFGTFKQPAEGLTSEEAARRLKEDGPNVLDAALKDSFFKVFFVQLKNIIFLMTLSCAFICWLMGDWVRVYILLFFVLFVVTMNTLGEWSGQDPGAALREQMAAEPVTVVRDGREQDIQVQHLVVGDVVKVKMGDLVPADMLVTQCMDLQTNEAMLTGEASECQKSLEPLRQGEAFPSNMLYSGTSVVCGKGKGEVVAVGMHTQVGLIAKRLKAERDLTVNPLQKSINFLGVAISGICFVVIIIATMVSFFSGYQNPANPCADDDDLCLFFSSLSRGLIMAISLIPHGLPFIIMMMLRVASFQMASRNAVVTRRTAVDYLGATSVICTDKTGTLTQGRMAAQVLAGLVRSAPGAAEPAAETVVEFYPLCGLSPNGGVFESGKLSKEAKARMDLKVDPKLKKQVFAEPGLPDLGAPEPDEPITQTAAVAQAQLAVGFLNCYGTELAFHESKGQWITSGNMTEAAVKVAAAKGGLWDAPDSGRGAELLNLHPPVVDLHVPFPSTKPPPDDQRGTELLHLHPRDADLEVPFTSKRKMMATVHAVPESLRLATLEFQPGTTHCAVVKGAPDQLFPKLKSVLAAGQDGRLLVPGGDILPQERQALEARNAELAGQALRSLLVAVCPLDAAQVASLRSKQAAEERLEELLTSPGLCFIGMWGIYDPPRPSVPESVLECHSAGIRVVMITGDQKPTAVAIAKQVHIIQEHEDPARKAAICKELHVSSRPVHVTRTTSGRLSAFAREALEASSPIREWRREEHKDAHHEGEGGLQRQISPREGPAIQRQLSVYDERGDDDKHEPKYRPPEEIADLSARVNVWARAQPTDKVALVESLISQEYITAMTGDGVNDAPALKRANAGVAMGISGTAVAKNSADLILMDDNFSTIVAAIKEGRRIYANTQKYVTFNLSVKAGECASLMVAIMLHVPMPIRGLQLLFNLLATHIIPTLSLAFEKPEPYVMRVPPRETKGDIIVNRVMWLYRWLPFVISLSTVTILCLALGVYTHTGFVTANALIGSSRVEAVEKRKAACAFAGNLDAHRDFIEDPEPFHCRCVVHPGGNPFAEPFVIEQWGHELHVGELRSNLDRWSGAISHDLYAYNNTPWRQNGTGTFLEPCTDHKGVPRYCWRNREFVGVRPLLPDGLNCAAIGAQLGQSMSYVVIHLGEILTLGTFRTDGPFWLHLQTNMVYLGFVVFNLACLALFLYNPFLNKLLGLSPLTALRFCIPCCFVALLIAMNELVKIVYRRKTREYNEWLNEEHYKKNPEFAEEYATRRALEGDCA